MYQSRVMDVPNILTKFSSKEKQEEQFLAIEIGSESVTTALWKVLEGQTEIVSIGTTEEWEVDEKNESLLTAIDASLAKSIGEVKSEPNKVIFGLQESWVDGESISKEYSKQLKQICEKFEFEPIGFVVASEAIIQLLKKKEGTPPTAILIRVNEAELQVSVVNLGKITGTETVARSEDIGADVEEGLARFEIDEKLPSRMLLYNALGDMEKLKQDLLSYSWLDKLPFLHFPKVKILESQTAIKAVAIAGGAEAAKALGFEIVKDVEKEESDDFDKKTEIKEETTELGEKETTQEEKPESREEQNVVVADAEEIGFHMHTDVSGKEEQKPKVEKIEEAVAEAEEEKELEENGSTVQGMNLREKLLGLLGNLSQIFTLPARKFSGIGGKLGSKMKVGVITSIAFLIFLLIAGVYGYWIIPKAKLVLYVRPKTLEKELVITIDPSSSQLLEGETIIPGKFIETEVESSKEKDATGNKTVGERAIGELTLYNKTSAEKSFKAGTILVGQDNLQFALDTDVKVASASAEESEESITTVFGKTKAQATATAIGADYNLSSSTEFRFKEFSTASYNAKNDTDFTGGSSREVQAISQDDIDELINLLTIELKEKAAQELEMEEGVGKEVLSDGAKTEIISEELSGKAGEEAQKIKATLRLLVSTIAYQQADLESVLRNAVSQSIPEDFELREEESVKEVQSVKYEEDTATITLLYKAILSPQINKDDIKNNIVGKYPQIAREYLESLPNYSKAEIEITPKVFPAKLKTFPRRKDNISIEIKVEK